MSEIHRVLRRAALRLTISRFIAAVIVLLTAALIVAAGLRVSEKLLQLNVHWARFAEIEGGAILFGAALWSLLRRDPRLAVARRVDEGADLRESLSTALCVASNPDAWSKVVVETATAKARTVNVARAVPVRLPRRWPAPLVAALALAAIWMLPVPDVLGKKAEAEKKDADKKAVVAAQVEVKSALAKVEEKLAKVDAQDKKGDEVKPESPTPAKPQSPEEIRKAAVKSLTSMKDKLEAMKAEGKGMPGEALKDKLAQLKQPGPGPLSDVAVNMAKGDFAKAKQSLDELEKKLAAGQMSPKEQEQLKDQLEKLAQQMEKLAADQKDLEKKLEQAGLDKKLATDPAALKAALEKMQGLSQEQKQQLMQQCNSQKQASGACQNMAAAMSKAANGMGKGGMSQEGMEGMGQMGEQMSEMEMAQAEMNNMEAALSECKNQLNSMCQSMGQCNNPGMGECQNGSISAWKPGESLSSGAGQGGPGHGSGNGTGEEETAANFTKHKANGPVGNGPIIGSTMVQGEQVKGESTAQFSAAVADAEQRATDAIETNVIEKQYQDVVKHYFGRLAAKTKAVDAPKPGDAVVVPSTTPAPATKP